MWSNFKNWWYTLTKEEYELTIYYPKDIKVDADGVKTWTKDAVLYKCSAVKKHTPTHFIFTDSNGHLHEIKLLEPVSYEIKKIY